jgi:hypothetical protein
MTTRLHQCPCQGSGCIRRQPRYKEPLEAKAAQLMSLRDDPFLFAT